MKHATKITTEPSLFGSSERFLGYLREGRGASCDGSRCNNLLASGEVWRRAKLPRGHSLPLSLESVKLTKMLLPFLSFFLEKCVEEAPKTPL